MEDYHHQHLEIGMRVLPYLGDSTHLEFWVTLPLGSVELQELALQVNS